MIVLERVNSRIPENVVEINAARNSRDTVGSYLYDKSNQLVVSFTIENGMID